MHAVSHCYCRYWFIIVLSSYCHYVLPMNDSPANVYSLSHLSVVQQWHARLVSSLMSSLYSTTLHNTRGSFSSSISRSLTRGESFPIFLHLDDQKNSLRLCQQARRDNSTIESSYSQTWKRFVWKDKWIENVFHDGRNIDLTMTFRSHLRTVQDVTGLTGSRTWPLPTRLTACE